MHNLLLFLRLLSSSSLFLSGGVPDLSRLLDDRPGEERDLLEGGVLLE